MTRQGLKELHREIKNLPYCNSDEEYLVSYNYLTKHKRINKELKDYLKNRNLTKEKWVKGYIKKQFTCGIFTSSRIEAKHSIYKRYLNGDTKLCELFKIFKTLESQEVTKYKDEITKLCQEAYNKYDDYDLIKYAKKYYGLYAIKKLQEVIYDSGHYKVEKCKDHW